MSPRRLIALMGHDLRLQLRYRIVVMIAAAALGYILALRLLGGILGDGALALLIYTDPSVLGFFLFGGLVIFERSESTRAALGVTPVTAAEYFASKAITLTLPALAVTLVMAVAAGKHANIGLLLLSVGLISVHYIGLGAIVAARAANVTGYLFLGAGLLTPLLLPGLLMLSGGEAEMSPLFIIPSAAHTQLLLAALTGQAESGVVGFCLVSSAVAALGAFLLAANAGRREFGQA